MKIQPRRYLANVLLCFAVSLSPAPALAGTYFARVVGVSDGDTVTVVDTANVQHKIRLMGIDAPEKKQAFGTASRQNLANLVFGKAVTIEANKEDRYGRELGKVMIGSKDANLDQIRSGLAWHYKQYERDQSARDRREYALAEAEARSARKGLWREADPMPPWEFRHR